MSKILFFLGSIVFCLLSLQAEEPHNHAHDADHNEYSIFAERLDLEVENPLKQLELQNSDNWHKFEERHGSWFVNFNTLTELPMRAAGKGIKVNIGGNAPQKALHFLQRELIDFPLPISQLEYLQTNTTDKYNYVEFRQFYEGLEVLNSGASIRITKDGKVVAFTLDVFQGIDVHIGGILEQENLKILALEDMKGNMEEVTIHPNLKILSIPSNIGANGYVFKVVYEADIIGKNEEGLPSNYYTLIDAQTGETYYRSNRIATYHAALDNPLLLGPVTDNSNWEVEMRALAHARVVLGGEEYITNELGQIPFVSDTRLEGIAYLEGPFCQVLIGEEGEEVPSYPIVVPANSSQVTLPEEVKLWETSVFYHTNRVHDFAKFWLPEDFDLLDYSMPTRVQRTDGSCNAFYNWNGINFYEEGGGCFSLAEFADVVFHEYGHAINHRVYEYYGNSMSNSSINEGYADVWSLSLTRSPLLAQGYRMGNDFIRRYDGFKKRFPENWINGGQHNNGEIIAGSWWDLQASIGFDTAFELFVQTQTAAPMRPNGQEGRLYADVLFEALVADDDDGDLANGTPHSEAIFKAFSDHGIALQVDADIVFNEVPIVESNTLIEVPIVIDIDFNYFSYLERISLRYKNQRSNNYKRIDVISLTNDNNYTAYMLSFDKGTIVNFYFELEDNGGASLPNVTFPVNVADEELPNHPYQLLVGYNFLENDDFSSTSNSWTAGTSNDDAKAGLWAIGSPVETSLRSGEVVQSGMDYSDGEDNLCAVTGLNSEFQDYSLDENRTGVWGGQTTLISPTYDLTEFEDPAFSYHRWFTNHQGVNPNTESWRVQISNDGETWKTVENTLRGDRTWRFVVVRVRDYVEPNATVQLRFIAEDKTPDITPVGGGEPYDGVSLVEAMVDDLSLYDTALTTNIEEANLVEQDWFTYPNPVREMLHIQYLGDKMQANQMLQLYNLTGQLVMEQPLQQAKESISVQPLAAGVYWLQIGGNEVVYRQKVVVY